MQFGIQNGIQSDGPGDPFRCRAPRAREVYDKLRGAIVTGEMRPNQALVESKLAKALGVSRTPMREALNRLEAMAYVTRLSNGRLIVVDHLPSQIQSWYEIRQALEVMAIKLASERGADEQMVRIEEAHRRWVEAMRNHNRDVDKIIELDDDFHHALYVGCENQKLLEFVMIFRDQYFVRRIARTFTANDWRATIREHETMLKALHQRNTLQAGRVLERHLRRVMRIALERL